MSAIRKDVQRQLFQSEEERLQAIVQVIKIDGKKKKRPTFLCLAVTIELPVSVRLYFVKGDKDDIYKKKDRYSLKDIKEVDGLNPKKALPDFHIKIQDKQTTITASSAEEKDEFIRELYKLSNQYFPVQMPDFCNVSLPVDNRMTSIMPIEAEDDQGHEIYHDYQPISTKEEADFRKLLAKADLTIGQADKFAEILSAQLQSLDGANINSMLGCEAAVNQLLGSLDIALTEVSVLEGELDRCDSILSNVRNSIELIEEKDSLSVVERRNKERLRQQLADFIAALEAVTDDHIRTLEDARLDDPKSIARCAEAARAVSQFWHGRVPKALLQMKAYKDRNSKLDIIDLFVDRLISHFTALFSNLNDLSMSSDWHSLSIPKQSQRFHALSPLSDLMSWLKTNRPVPYNAAIQRYVDATKLLYKRLFDRFFESVLAEINKLGNASKKLDITSTSLRSDKQSIASDPTSVDFDSISSLIEIVLGELGPVVEKEQKFCTRFFHINSELIAQAETASTGSGDSSNIGGRNMERFMNEQVRSVMGPMLEPLNMHLKKFAEAICKQNPSNVLLLFVLLSKKVLGPQDAGSYFSVTFGTLVVLVKREFDLYMESEGRALEDSKLSKRTRVGILPSIERFSTVVRNCERVFEKSERRADLEKWYGYMYRCLVDGIGRVSNNPNSKSPPQVVRFENFHEFYMALSELKISCLDVYRKELKREKEENISSYVQELLGKPLEKVHLFFEGITTTIALRGTKPEEISYQPQFSRLELKKVISQYPAKEVKKGLEQLYKKLEKHLVANSLLLQVVWRQVLDQFIKQLQEYQTIMADCYPGAKVDLEFGMPDVLAFFSEIASQH